MNWQYEINKEVFEPPTKNKEARALLDKMEEMQRKKNAEVMNANPLGIIIHPIMGIPYFFNHETGELGEMAY